MLLKYLKIFQKSVLLHKISCTFLALGIYIYGHSFIISNFISFLIRKNILEHNFSFFKNLQELSKLNLFTFGISPTISSFFSINLLKGYCRIKNKFISKLIESNIFFIFLFLSFSIAKFYNISKNIKINSLSELFNLIITFLILILGSVVAKKISSFIDLYGFGNGVTLLFLIDTELSFIKNLFLSKTHSLEQFKIFCFFLLFFIPLYLSTQTIKIKIAKSFNENLKTKPLSYNNSEFIKLKLPIYTIYPLILTSNLFIFIQKKFTLDEKNYFIYYSLLYCCTFIFYFFSFDIEKILDYFQQKTILIVENSVLLSSSDQTKKFLIKKLFKFIALFSFLFVLIFLIKDYFISLVFSSRIVEIYFFTSISSNLMLSFLVEAFPKLKIIYLEKKLEWLSFSLNL